MCLAMSSFDHRTLKAYQREIRDRRDFSERHLLVGFMNRLIDSDRLCGEAFYPVVEQAG